MSAVEPRTPLDDWLAAAPLPQRAGLLVLRALAKRPGGMRLLHRLAPADQLAYGITAMDHFEDPVHATPLGWDAEAVAARGRALRREEGRP